ncbi:hypothetical protein V6N12_045729 [Hibiscus sabdariffa]|uniref:DUF7075 domain-containing protein n=1 Tax=Hibiscus sabdariffa TaxID=183260 RepID=A0ABR2G3V7_9ROSI
MATPKSLKIKPRIRSPIRLQILGFITAIALLLLWSYFNSTTRFSFISAKTRLKKKSREHPLHDKYLYWGDRIDCPGKHCDSCEGLGHQESSLRCALEEAIFLNRTFVMPSRMCINPIHNKKGILHKVDNVTAEERWAATSCALDSLYDIDLISETVPVILDNTDAWHLILSTSMKLGARGVAHVEGLTRVDLKDDSRYSNLLLINRTASPLSWFAECKDRMNRSAIILPYSFLPSMAAEKLRIAADQIKNLLGDYDAIHVRRGDKIKTRKDRIQKWVPSGRTLFIASNERTPGFFSPLSVRYKLAYSSNYSHILDPLIKNNYELFMIERLVLMGAKTIIKTFKEDNADLSLTDDPKKNTKLWQIPVYTLDGEES